MRHRRQGLLVKELEPEFETVMNDIVKIVNAITYMH